MSKELGHSLIKTVQTIGTNVLGFAKGSDLSEKIISEEYNLHKSGGKMNKSISLELANVIIYLLNIYIYIYI